METIFSNKRILVDTTVVIEHLRGNPAAKLFLQNNTPSVSHVTIAELIQGTRDKKELRAVEQVVGELTIIPIEESYATLALTLMKQFYHSHHLIFLDALIAATALENNLTLVTANVKHFSFIKKLSLSPWKTL